MIEIRMNINIRGVLNPKQHNTITPVDVRKSLRFPIVLTVSIKYTLAIMPTGLQITAFILASKGIPNALITCMTNGVQTLTAQNSKRIS